MKNILVVGASSSVAKILCEKYRSEYNFIRLSREEEYSDVSAFDCLDSKSFYDKDIAYDGLVFFSGSINLKPFDNAEINEFKKDFDIHLFGLINILKFYNKKFNSGASVVLIGTVATKQGMPFHSIVSTVKSAVNGLAISLAAEWAPRIRVNVISPSLFKSKMSERFFRNEKVVDKIKNNHPMKRLGSVEDISSIINFMLSDDSSWITGQNISVDGGISSIKL